MQLRTKVIGAAGIAALVAAGGFAFTASSSIPNNAVGYASQGVTGVNVTKVNWTMGVDNDHLAGVVFTTTENLKALPNAATSVDVTLTTDDATHGANTCDWTTTANQITCSFTDETKPTTNDINHINLLVRNNGA